MNFCRRKVGGKKGKRHIKLILFRTCLTRKNTGLLGGVQCPSICHYFSVFSRKFLFCFGILWFVYAWDGLEIQIVES